MRTMATLRSLKMPSIVLLVAVLLGVPLAFGSVWMYQSLRPVTFVLVMAATLTVPISLGLLWLYNRAVLAGMRRHGGVDEPVDGRPDEIREVAPLGDGPPGDGPPGDALSLTIIGSGATIDLPPAARAIFARAAHGARMSVLVYAAAGLAYALSATCVMFVASGLQPTPLRTLVILWANLWPLAIAIDLIAVTEWKARVRNAAIYAALGAILAVIASENWLGVPIFWGLLVALPTVFLVPLLHPRLRAVGPLVFAFTVIAVGGGLAAYTTVAGDAETLAPATSNADGRIAAGRIAAGTTLGDGLATEMPMNDLLAASGEVVRAGGLVLVGLALFGLLGWLALAWIGRLYQAKYISDRSIVIDLVWVVFTLNEALQRSFEGLEWGIVALGSFGAYKLVSVVGFALAARHAEERVNHRLLLLRVFGFRSRSERLISLVGSQWRYVGSIQLIVATDLASTIVAPHEFLDFARGKLKDRYVKSRAGLERQLAELDVRPDGDGRFRMNELFCHDDTWKITLSRLAASDDVVLMDLRGFSPANQGCCFELEQLVNLVPLSKVALIVDRTTDVPFLRDVLDRAWASIPARSPNRRGHPARLAAYRLDRDDATGAAVVLAGLAGALVPDIGGEADRAGGEEPSAAGTGATRSAIIAADLTARGAPWT